MECLILVFECEFVEELGADVVVAGKVVERTGKGKGKGNGFDDAVPSMFVLSLNISSLEDECSGSVEFSSGIEYSIIELVKLLVDSISSSTSSWPIVSFTCKVSCSSLGRFMEGSSIVGSFSSASSSGSKLVEINMDCRLELFLFLALCSWSWPSSLLKLESFDGLF